jgi:S-adenosylmethionine hydrolase
VSVVVDPALAASLPLGVRVEVLSVHSNGAAAVALRAIRTFSDLDGGELGLMADANGHLALVAREGSAAMLLDLGVGDLLELSW